MLLTIDMQGAQTDSRFRGIGRYTRGIVRALIETKSPDDDIILVLNGRLGEGIDHIRREFRCLLPENAFRVWYPPGWVNCFVPQTAGIQKASELIHARFIETLRPDAVLYSSIFDSPIDPAPAPSCLAGKCHQSAIIYDFIPLHDAAYLSNNTLRSWYNSRLSELQSLSTLFCISDFVADEAASRIPGPVSIAVSTNTDALFSPKNARPLSALDISPVFGRLDGRPFVLYSGGTDGRKNIDALIRAFRLLPDSIRGAHQLIIVCGSHPDAHLRLRQAVRTAGLPQRDVVLLGYVSDEALCSLYAACKLFVFPSLDEGFGLPVLEAMRCGAPVIASNQSSIPEVVGLDEALFDPTDVEALSVKMSELLSDDAARKRLSDHSKVQQQKFSWEKSAQKVWDTLHRDVPLFEKTRDFLPSPLSSGELTFDFCTTLSRLISTSRLVQTADALDRTFPADVECSVPQKHQLFVDISTLCHIDLGTGIQRVTRSILSNLLNHPPEGWVVRPVYATADHSGYRHAHTYTLEKFGFDDGEAGDIPVTDHPGDFFLGLDLQPNIVPLQQPALHWLHRRGVRIWFVVYDLIPVQLPQYVRSGNPYIHTQWLTTISGFDGVMCISQAVADEMRDWVAQNAPGHLSSLDIRWFHLGSDIENSVPTRGLPPGASDTLETLKSRPTFLMVSTIEPRKGYAQTLRAFDLLWDKGVDVNLTIVGREGWNVSHIIQRMKKHPLAGKRLFWLNGISDEYLSLIYEASAAVLMASEAEGFGLAVVEGARHKKPLILRGLPVFREIAGNSAFYFNGLRPEELAQSVEQWMKLYSQGKAPSSDGVEMMTWAESTQMILKRLPLHEDSNGHSDE